MEIWKTVKGFEDYKVSNLGNVKSFKRDKEKLLKQLKTKNGYLNVNLCKNGICKLITIHSLVSKEFLNHKPNGFKLVVNHINFNKLDNRVENLEIITNRENSNKKHIKSSSDFVGVSLIKNTLKYRSIITIKGKAISLGIFDTELEASEFYKKAIKNSLLGLPIEVKKPIKTSNYKGVSFKKKSNKWIAQIQINNKKQYLGSFDTELEAYNIYTKKLVSLQKN